MGALKIAVAAAAALGMSLATVSPVAAHGTLVCHFSGDVEVSPPVQFIGGTGSVSLFGIGTCLDSGVASPANVSGTGTYVNVVCGTGTMALNLAVTTYRTHNVSAAAQIAGGQGPLTTQHGGVPGRGTIHLHPSSDNDPSPPGDCITGWAFRMTLGELSLPTIE